MAIVEAASVGLLVVSTRVGGVPEVNIAAAPGGGGVSAHAAALEGEVSAMTCAQAVSAIQHSTAQHDTVLVYMAIDRRPLSACWCCQRALEECLRRFTSTA
jgi:hypothetical protein